jgi:hypothetical protein
MIRAPSVDKALCLYGLAAKNPQRRDDDGDAQRMWRGILHMAEVSRRALSASHTPLRPKPPGFGIRDAGFDTGWREDRAYRSDIGAPIR